MAKVRNKHPIQKALDTCHSTMASWFRKKIEKKNKASRTGSAGYAKLKIKLPPEGGWPGGAPESNGWKPGGGK